MYTLHGVSSLLHGVVIAGGRYCGISGAAIAEGRFCNILGAAIARGCYCGILGGRYCKILGLGLGLAIAPQ